MSTTAFPSRHRCIRCTPLNEVSVFVVCVINIDNQRKKNKIKMLTHSDWNCCFQSLCGHAAMEGDEGMLMGVRPARRSARLFQFLNRNVTSLLVSCSSPHPRQQLDCFVVQSLLEALHSAGYQSSHTLVPAGARLRSSQLMSVLCLVTQPVLVKEIDKLRASILGPIASPDANIQRLATSWLHSVLYVLTSKQRPTLVCI